MHLILGNIYSRIYSLQEALTMPHFFPSINGLVLTLEEAQRDSAIKNKSQNFFQQLKFLPKLNDIYLMSQFPLKEGQ